VAFDAFEPAAHVGHLRLEVVEHEAAGVVEAQLRAHHDLSEGQRVDLVELYEDLDVVGRQRHQS